MTGLALDGTLPAAGLPGCLEPLGGMGNATEVLLRRLSGLRGRLDTLVVFLPPSFPETEARKYREAGFEVRTAPPAAALPDVLTRCADWAGERGVETLLLHYIDEPLLDVDVASALLDLHRSSGAEYTFADNLPEGMAPEVLARGFLAEIRGAKPKPPETASRRVFDRLDADINRWFAEVWLPERDLSLHRLEFRTDTPRNRRVLAGILRRDPSADHRTVCRLLEEAPSVFRPWPKYVEFEAVNRGRPCLYLPVSRRPETFLDFGLFVSVCRQLAEGLPDVIAAFAGPNEPLLHPRCAEMVEAALEAGLMSFVLETDAGLLTDDLARRLSALPPSRFQLVVRVDAARPETYGRIHPGGDLAAVVDRIGAFLASRPENPGRTFVQFVKLRENLEEMEEFWRFWESRGAHPLIQKSNDFAGRFPLERVSDLSPLDRIPCWHLRRGMVVLADGRVPVCKQDWDAEHPVADLTKVPVAEAWAALEPYHEENTRQGWTAPGALNPRCGSCDEWYVFDF